MKNTITKKEFEDAEIKMNQILSLATQKGGFDNLTLKENASLEKYTQIVKDYEDQNYSVNRWESSFENCLMRIWIYRKKAGPAFFTFL